MKKFLVGLVGMLALVQIEKCQGFELRHEFYTTFMKELEENHTFFQSKQGDTSMYSTLIKMAQHQEQRVYDKLKRLSYAEVFTIFKSSETSKDEYDFLRGLSWQVGVLNDKSITSGPLFFHESSYPESFRLWYRCIYNLN